VRAALHAEERRSRIADYLRQAEFASLEELVRQVDASVSTVRRDLIALEEAGSLRRTHGGAKLLAPKAEDEAGGTGRGENPEEKDQIGRACAERVGQRQSLILDAGSTVCRVASFLEQKQPQIFTNSLPVANLFAASNQVEVLMSGGILYPRLGVLVGPLAERAFSEVHADVAIMGGSGICEDGVYNSHALLISIQRTMLAAARKVIFCLDHTKFGRKSMSRLCGLSEIHMVITDAKAPADQVEMLRQAGVEVVLA
jgi:DeoR family transcriptional regulator, fructose operon transcriptional repressor